MRISIFRNSKVLQLVESMQGSFFYISTLLVSIVTMGPTQVWEAHLGNLILQDGWLQQEIHLYVTAKVVPEFHLNQLVNLFSFPKLPLFKSEEVLPK